MQDTVKNPRALTDLWDGREIGDPFLMRFDGRFYLYCSTHGEGGIKCWTSEDMIHFDYRGFVCTDARISGAYAPEVQYNNGKFYMVTSPKGSGHYLLSSDSPLGPFNVLTPNLGIGIDGSLFVDDDGKSYFYRASPQGIRVHKMPAPDEIDMRSEVIGSSYLGHWTEGPQVIKRDGRYFLTDTGNHVLSKGYHVDYCVSSQGPDRGYRRMRDSVLLLETRDNFHALGHSSSCVGPDMDTMYIIYHKNILDAHNRPFYRSLNIDRFFFNGDRMYTNATWWTQPAPHMPVCVSRDGEGLIDGNLPIEAGATFTAEICLRMTADKVQLHFGECTLTFNGNRTWTLSGAGVSAKGTWARNIAMNALITVKASLHKGNLCLYVNNQAFWQGTTAMQGGLIGIDEGAEPSFMGLSDVAQGSHDNAFPMSVPGSFDAVHCDGAEAFTEGEAGCKAVALKAGQTLKRVMNVESKGAYYLSLTIKGLSSDATITVNGQTLSAAATGVFAEDGIEKRCFGRLELPEGMIKFELTAAQDMTVDRIFLSEATEIEEQCIIEQGADVSNGALHVIGHKAAQSMHTKWCGYTAAEGLGEGYTNGIWHDGEVQAVLQIAPVSPEARADIYLRTSRASWHPHQVASSRIGYCLRITEKRLALFRQAYGETLLAECPLNLPWGEKLKLTFRAAGNNITVLSENKTLLSITDPTAFPCGYAGISAVCDGIGFHQFSVHPFD